MGRTTLQPGDRVVTMQVAGVCTLVGRRGRYVEIETPQGRRVTVVESAVRRLDGEAPTPKDG